MANVLHHAHNATGIDGHLTAEGEQVRLTIRDDSGGNQPLPPDPGRQLCAPKPHPDRRSRRAQRGFASGLRWASWARDRRPVVWALNSGPRFPERRSKRGPAVVPFE